MANWQEIAPNTYKTKVGDIDIEIFEAAYETWTFLLNKHGRLINGGNCRALEEAKERAVRAAEG